MDQSQRRASVLWFLCTCITAQTPLYKYNFNRKVAKLGSYFLDAKTVMSMNVLGTIRDTDCGDQRYPVFLEQKVKASMIWKMMMGWPEIIQYGNPWEWQQIFLVMKAMYNIKISNS